MKTKYYVLGAVLACGAIKAAAEETDVLRTVYRTAMNRLRDPIASLKLTGQAMVESGGRGGAVSRAGAKGPFQFMPATAKELGLHNPHDPVGATAAAIKYMGSLTNQFKNPWLALAAYNGGTGHVSRALETGGNWVQQLPRETREYPAKVHAAYQGLLSGGFLDKELPLYGKDTTGWWRYRKAFPSGPIFDKLEQSRKAYFDSARAQLGLK